MTIESALDAIPDGWRLYTVDMSIEDRARVMLKGPMYVNAGGVSVPEYVCEVGSSLESAVAAASRKAANTYRGWTISYDPPPIPIRDFDWRATGPNYDASYEGAEDGWVDNGEKASAATREALIAEIDALFDERASAIEARSDETRSGSAEGESAAAESRDAHNSSAELYFSKGGVK